jgi:hypothetical protein
MCQLCTHIDREIKRLQKRRKEIKCIALKSKLKHPHRAEYFADYYRANRDKKLAEMNERNRRLSTGSGSKKSKRSATKENCNANGGS